MTMHRDLILSSAVGYLLFAMASAIASGPAPAFSTIVTPPQPSPAAAAPHVTKVDPPNWWTGHTWSPVQVLVRGTSLQGARVEATTPGLHVGPSRVSAAGTYLFVEVRIEGSAPAGSHPLRLVTSGGAVTVPFDLIAPLPRTGRFQGFSEDDMIYLLMPDRFANGEPANDEPMKSRGILNRAMPRYWHGGDLQGVIDRLPYLKDLGVTAVWMNPVYDNADHPDYKEVINGEAATDYHGFHAIDFYAVDERFGDLAKLRELVDRAHALGLKVIQDQVANHTCGFHPWVKDSPTPTWFHGTEERHLANTFQTHLLMDPNTPAPVKQPTLDGWFVDILPDLNQDDEDVARYLIQNSLWWVGMTGLDGIRQDTVPYVERRFWSRWTSALRREYPDLRVIGEVLDGSVPFVSFFQTGRRQWDGIDSGLDTLFDYPLFFALRKTFAQGGSIRETVDVLHQDHLYPAPQRLVTLLGSHDVRRFMSEPGATIAGLELATTFLFTMRGTPQWYYGDEIAMPGDNDPDNRRDFPGGWPGDPRSAFDAAGRTRDEQQVFAHVRTMAALRRDLEPLRRGRLVHLRIDEQVYVFARTSEAGTVLVAINNATTPVVTRVDTSPVGLPDGTTLTDRLNVAAGGLRITGNVLEVSLPARGAAVLTPR